MTEAKKTAAEVIAAVMHDVQAVGKKDRNQAQGFNFRGIDAVVNAVGPALRKHGGLIVPVTSEVWYDTIPAKNGGSLNVARVTVTYEVIAAESGDGLAGTVVAEAFDSGDKATAKAMSVAYRTFLLQLLCLPTDEPDPDSYSYETAAVVSEWSELLEGVETRKDALALYDQARDAKAPKAVLDAIAAKGKTLA